MQVELLNKAILSVTIDDIDELYENKDTKDDPSLGHEHSVFYAIFSFILENYIYKLYINYIYG